MSVLKMHESQKEAMRKLKISMSNKPYRIMATQQKRMQPWLVTQDSLLGTHGIETRTQVPIFLIKSP